MRLLGAPPLQNAWNPLSESGSRSKDDRPATGPSPPLRRLGAPAHYGGAFPGRIDRDDGDGRPSHRLGNAGHRTRRRGGGSEPGLGDPASRRGGRWPPSEVSRSSETPGPQPRGIHPGRREPFRRPHVGGPKRVNGLPPAERSPRSRRVVTGGFFRVTLSATALAGADLLRPRARNPDRPGMVVWTTLRSTATPCWKAWRRAALAACYLALSTSSPRALHRPMVRSRQALRYCAGTCYVRPLSARHTVVEGLAPEAAMPHTHPAFLMRLV